MSEAITVALITGGITLLGSVIGIVASYRTATSKVSQQLTTQQALMSQELQTIKDDVKEHNHYAKLFAETMPVVQEQIRVINHRIKDIEEAQKYERKDQ